MIGISFARMFFIASVALSLAVPAAAATIGPSGVYSENFDSMGAAGTVAPDGWKVHQIAGASSTWINDTGSNSTPDVGAIPNGASVAGGAASPGLVASNAPTANQVFGYNAGAPGDPANRGIATAPTGIAGSVIELQLMNGTAAAQNKLQLSYDIRRYQVGADNAGRTPGAGIPEGSEELPGYWPFYSLDNGASFTAVNSLIPVGAGPSSNPIVPNTVGVTSVAGTMITLGGPWNPGANLILRWIDDNAIDPSPDQIIGIDNVQIVIPEPASMVLLVMAALVGGFIRRRSQIAG